MNFDKWWSQYGKDRDSNEYAVAKDAYAARDEEIKEKDIIINFLKKELIHKTAYKNVMKRQYRELREKYETVKPRVKFQFDIKLHQFAWFDITEWSQEEVDELTAKWKEIELRKKINP